MSTSETRRNLKLRFSSNPANLEAALGNLDNLFVEATIQERRELSAAEYDAFVADFTTKADWLTGRGGWTSLDGYRVVEVTAHRRHTLYIDPEGSRYAKHVGAAVGGEE